MPQMTKTRRLQYADVSVNGEVLSVRTRRDPHLYDLKVLVTQYWLPSIVIACGFCYAVSFFYQVWPSVVVGFWITLPLTIQLVPILKGIHATAEFTFDRTQDEFCISGCRLGTLSRIADVLLQTRLGASGNRRFRLVVQRREYPEVVMAWTPLLEDGFHQHQYYGETYAENFGSTFRPWEDYQGQRNGIDWERDADIFELAEKIKLFLSLPIVADQPQAALATHHLDGRRAAP